MAESNADLSDQSLLTIGATVGTLQAEFPDISHSSLRFLEREGLITSVRTAGGHRLYSQADLARIEQIKRWQQNGISLEAIRRRLEVRDSLPEPGQLSTEFLQLAEAHRTDDARRLIRQAERAGLAPSTLFFEVLRPALVTVGHQWQAGELPVFEEKTISELCRELIMEITLRNAPDYPNGPLVIAACVEGEQHELGLQMVYGLLRQRGYCVRYLGADVATVFLAGAVAANQPDAVLLSSSTEKSFDRCIATIGALRQLRTEGIDPVIIVGGSIVERHMSQIVEAGAVPIADEDALDRLGELLSVSNSARS